MRLKRREQGKVLLYQGSNNAYGKQHLVRSDAEETLCGRVDVERTRTGKVNRNKASTFNGFDCVLGRMCSYCRELYEDGGEAF